MADPTLSPDLSGVRTGEASPASPAPKPTAVDPGRQAPGTDSAEGKQLSQTPEAIRKRNERAARAAELAAKQPPPPLNPISPGSASSAPAASPANQTQAGLAPGAPGDSFDHWVAEDFRGCGPEIVELLEAWCVSRQTRKAVEGGLPKVVVEEIAEKAAFPANSKRSLSRTCHEPLADFANAIGLPTRLKPLVSSVPAAAMILLHQIQIGAQTDKLIAKDREEREPTKPEKPPQQRSHD